MFRVLIAILLVSLVGCDKTDSMPTAESALTKSGEKPGVPSPSLVHRPNQEIYASLGFSSIHVFDWTVIPPEIHSTNTSLSEEANEFLLEVTKSDGHLSGEVLLAIPLKSEKMSGRLVIKVNHSNVSETRVIGFDFKPEFLLSSGGGNMLKDEFQPKIDVTKEWCTGHQLFFGGNIDNPDWSLAISQVRTHEKNIKRQALALRLAKPSLG